MIAGLVLAGGHSRRFGTEKALAMVGGSPMLRLIADLLQPATGALAVSAKSQSGAAALARDLGYPVLQDHPAYPEGPLAGVHAGLVWAAGVGADRLILAPCDTPFLPADFPERMIAADPTRPALAVAGGEAEPLCSIWPITLLEALSAALKHGHPPIGDWLKSHNAVEVAFSDAARFRNVNRPSDLD